MPRKPRIERNGYYHIINRGVAKNSIFLENSDYSKFLEILEEASKDYGFEIYSYCLMGNHYHLLIKINKENLSAIMQKVNSRYSIYFNKKYNRVGPLWQGRFKSWYVYDDVYLYTLVRYIEFNPIKVGITKKIGEYRWAMSSFNCKFLMLNFELLKKVDLTKDFSQSEQTKLDEFSNKKIEINNNSIDIVDKLPLNKYFENHPKEEAIYNAIKDGYTQSEVAKHLKLSNVAISKILKIYKQKISFFQKLKEDGIFWSYSKDTKYENFNDSIIIEHTLKYGDFDDIKKLITLFGKRRVKKVWEESMKSDTRFIKINLLIARVFLGLNIDAKDLKEVKNARLEKLKLFAS
jgi:REP element-mobilizing transposase RayT